MKDKLVRRVIDVYGLLTYVSVASERNKILFEGPLFELQKQDEIMKLKVINAYKNKNKLLIVVKEEL